MSIEQLRKLDERLNSVIQQEKEQKKNQADKILMSKHIGEQVKEAVAPLLVTASQNNKATQEAVNSLNAQLGEQKQILREGIKGLSDGVKEAVSQLKIEVPEIKVPPIESPKMPQINVPKSEVVVDTKGIEKTLREAFKGLKPPTVNVPKANIEVKAPKIPDLKWPDGEMPIKGWVSLMGVNLENPLPVQLRDAKGKPVDFNLGQSVSSSPRIVGVKNDPSNPLYVDLVDATGIGYSGSNPLPVGGTVAVSGITNSTGVSILGSDGLAFGTSKPIPVTMVTGVSASVNAAIIDSAGNYRDTFPVSGTVIVSSVTASTAASLVDSTGVQYSGSNPVPTNVSAALPAGTNTLGAVKSVPSDIDINGANANHAQKYYTNAGAVTDGIVWSPAAGKRWHILTLYIQVSAAATVTLEDDLAGGDSPVWKGELAANSGVVLTYDKEHPFCSGEDAADLIITTTAGNVYVQAVGYEV